MRLVAALALLGLVVIPSLAAGQITISGELPRPAVAAGSPIRLPTLAPGEILLEIEAIGVSRQVADMAVVRVPITSTGASAAEARTTNMRLSERLVRAARTVGVSEADIQLTGSNDRLGFVGNELPEGMGGHGPTAQPRYSDQRVLRLQVRQITQFPRLREALELAGAKNVLEPTYGLQDGSASQQTAKARAFAKARADADATASLLNMTVGRILRVSDRSVNNSSDAANLREMFLQMSGQAEGQDGVVETSTRISVDFALAPKRP